MAALVTAFLEVGDWVLGAFVIPPTGFEELRGQLGLSGALLQLALSAGALVVLTTGWLLCSLWMRRGHNGARLVMIALAGLSLLFVLTDMSMNGLAPDWTALSQHVPELFTAAIAIVLLLPGSQAFFSASSALKRVS
ncbi:hypothetical protein AB0C96_37275 [Streptomyces sp. NPDC048506]|uniref:hypothetical protein n=1 Tax=Streptomyces sp. NPDC048506 TaxID=3155028 RepID=UPI003418CFB0